MAKWAFWPLLVLFALNLERAAERFGWDQLLIQNWSPTMDRALSILQSTWVQFPAIFLLGLTVGVWLDAKLRRREETLTGQQSSDDEYGIYEGAHERLMLFVVDHLLPTCGAQVLLQSRIIEQVCGSEILVSIAKGGLLTNDMLFKHYYERLESICESPTRYIPFDEMESAVDYIEKNYKKLRAQADDLAQIGNFQYQSLPQYQEWAKAHNELVAAYEAIKKDSRFKKLFRPSHVRQSRWGGVMPEI
jgi:hypothetical protein